jgi:hypothetical protein
MSQKTSVVRNRITIDDRTYEARALGGGRFDVFNKSGVRIGTFSVKARVVEAEDLGIEGADPVGQIGRLWVAENLPPSRDSKPEINTTYVKPVEPVFTKPEPPPPPVAPQPAVQGQIPAPAPSEGGPSKKICRISTYSRPDTVSLAKALAYHSWLRTQPGVEAAYFTQDPESGKTVSVTIWENKEKLAAMRFAKPPPSAVNLKAVHTDMMWIIG